MVITASRLESRTLRNRFSLDTKTSASLELSMADGI
jgi:hypothetical protein